eukprot:5795270-Lingulodinium_polyedra.AAC.1
MYSDPDRDRQPYQSIPEIAKSSQCNEVFQDHTPTWRAIKEKFESGGGNVFHDLNVDQIRMVYSNAVRRER